MKIEYAFIKGEIYSIPLHYIWGFAQEIFKFLNGDLQGRLDYWKVINFLMENGKLVH